MTISKTLELAERIKNKLGGDSSTHDAKTPLEVAETLVSKAASARTKLSRAQVIKRLEVLKAKYQDQYSMLNELRSKRDILETKISEVDSRFKATRKEMMDLSQRYNTMNLSGSKAIIMQEDCDDVSYIKDDIEYHIDVDAIGDVKSVPMKEYKKMMKDLAKKAPEEEKEELTEKDVEGIVEDKEESEEPKSEEEEELTEEDVEGLLEDEDDADVSDDVAIGDYYKK